MNSEYTVTVGLEIHAELSTATKMFCNSKNDPEEQKPNVHICPICMGHPGTLPTINKQAVLSVLRVGVAVSGTLADFTEFDRKNYFYPDIPKNYQISQYKYPLVSGGSCAGVDITRIHLEEDTARSNHGNDGKSFVDYNRAGVPLMELVTEPVIHSAKQAGDFARELQLLLRYLKVSNANLEKGEMRIEANISVSKTDTFGTKVEVKNLNSFKAVEKAIDFEVARHIEVLENGGTLVQETRGWDENKEITWSQRAKENSMDYRYFPDPDLPKLKLSELAECQADTIQKSLPELPWQKRKRYADIDSGMSSDDIEIFVSRSLWAEFFDTILQKTSDTRSIKVAANILISELPILSSQADPNSDLYFGKLTPEHIIDIATMKEADEISSRGVKDILKHIYEEGGVVRDVAEKNGMLQQSDIESLKAIVKTVCAENPQAVLEYKSGKMQSIQFLVGQGMKATKGSGNPAVLKKLLEEELA